MSVGLISLIGLITSLILFPCLGSHILPCKDLSDSNDNVSPVASELLSSSAYDFSDSGSDQDPPEVGLADAPEPSVAVLPPPPLPPPMEPPPVLEPELESQGTQGFRPLGVQGAASHAYYTTTHGKLTYYSSSKSFEAVCRFPGHGDCRITRTGRPPKGIRIATHRHQGRVAPLLLAWLELASHDQTTSVEHKLEMPSFASRRAARDRLKAGGPCAQALLEGERPPFDFEPNSEPSEFEPFVS